MNQFAKPGLAEEKLPPVGSSDNGKVLGVTDGAWGKIAAPSGLPEIGEGDTGKVLTATADGAAWQSGGSSGGGVLVANATVDDGAYVCDKTAQEIGEFSKTGAVLFIVDAVACYPRLIGYVNDTEDDNFFFAAYVGLPNNDPLAEQPIIDALFTADTADDYPTYTIEDDH